MIENHLKLVIEVVQKVGYLIHFRFRTTVINYQLHINEIIGRMKNHFSLLLLLEIIKWVEAKLNKIKWKLIQTCFIINKKTDKRTNFVL